MMDDRLLDDIGVAAARTIFAHRHPRRGAVRTNRGLVDEFALQQLQVRQLFGEGRGSRYRSFVVIDESLAGADLASWREGAVAHEQTRQQHQTPVVGFDHFARQGAKPLHGGTKHLDGLVDRALGNVVDLDVGAAMIPRSATAACRIDDGKNRRGAVTETPHQQGCRVRSRQQHNVRQFIRLGRGCVARQYRVIEFDPERPKAGWGLDAAARLAGRGPRAG